MRTETHADGFRARAISGTHTVKVAPGCDRESRKGLLGFAFLRTSTGGSKWLRSLKMIVPNPQEARDPADPVKPASFTALEQHDENMLLIRGDTRIADMYLTEFDQLVRHFYFFDTADELAGQGGEEAATFPSVDDSWSTSSFWRNGFTSARRRPFFLHPDPTWAERAAGRADNG